MAHQAGTYPGFCSMKRLGVFLLPPGWNASPSQGSGVIAVTPSIKFAGTHLCTWVERGTVRVKFLAQEHNTMSPNRSGARTRSARSRVERANHEAIPPLPKTLTLFMKTICDICYPVYPKNSKPYLRPGASLSKTPDTSVSGSKSQRSVHRGPETSCMNRTVTFLHTAGAREI